MLNIQDAKIKNYHYTYITQYVKHIYFEFNYLRDPKDAQYQDVLAQAEKHDPI